eukprot:scaffold13537_cov22-Tisochrysis_lutea.AAC.2
MHALVTLIAGGAPAGCGPHSRHDCSHASTHPARATHSSSSSKARGGLPDSSQAQPAAQCRGEYAGSAAVASRAI